MSLAQYDLGMSYLEGRELPKSDVLANKWFGQAARGNVTQATHELARSYYAGRGIARSYPKAANLFASAAHDGHREAQLSYAYMLESGLGAPKNIAEARLWYRRGAEHTMGTGKSAE
ncbi:MAG: tetratricopeptide repeat protein [Pseudonocardiaceae bacterium]